ncbi:hypothetical protein LCGC14_1570470 [marine sediment metagenome]|uniref:DUF2793 domain-containing protein n=1 Tax=marine sediment metagenome TaxID=412755 RepID=A0A0F9LK71_9ZZZZ
MAEEQIAELKARLNDLEEAIGGLKGRRLANADQLQGRRISSAVPASADVLKWNATTRKYEPEAPSTAIAHTFDSTHHTDVATMTEAQGDVIYRDGSGDWQRLGAGTSGRFLKTQGAAANPVWAALPTATTSVQGIAELATVAEANAGTDTGRTVTPDSIGSPIRSIVLTAAGGAPSTTTPCAGPTKVEAGTNDVDYWVLDFDATSDEYAFWGPIAMPENYGGGTFTAIFYWTTTNTSTNGVAWAIQMKSLDNSDAIDAAWGTAVVTTDDNLSAAGDVLVTAASSAITPSGTASAPEMLFVRVFRDVSDANDDMTQDARLIAIKIEYSAEGYSD